jgi:hypothetical protein
MLYCPSLFEKVKNGIAEEKSTEEIFKSVCGAKIKHPERKLRRIIRMSFGKEKKEEAQKFLEDNAKILKYKKSNNFEGVNGKSQVKNSTSDSKVEETSEGPIEVEPDISGSIPDIKRVEFDPDDFNFKVEDEFEEDPKEDKFKLTLQPDVKKVLDFYKIGTTKEGKYLRTYNNAIRYAFKEAGLWDIPE